MQYKKVFAVAGFVFSAIVLFGSSGKGRGEHSGFQNDPFVSEGGTLIIAIPYREGVVICSDKRVNEATIGSPGQNDDTEVKIFPIGRDLVFAIAGTYRVSETRMDFEWLRQSLMPTPTPTPISLLSIPQTRATESPTIIIGPDGKLQIVSKNQDTPQDFGSLLRQPIIILPPNSEPPATVRPTTISFSTKRWFNIVKDLREFYRANITRDFGQQCRELATLANKSVRDCGKPCSYQFFSRRGQASLFDILIFRRDGKQITGKKGKYVFEMQLDDITRDELSSASAELTIGQSYLIKLIKDNDQRVKELSENPLIKKIVLDRPSAKSISMIEAVQFGKLIIEESSKRAAQFGSHIHISPFSDVVVFDQFKGVRFYPSPEIPQPSKLRRYTRKFRR